MKERQIKGGRGRGECGGNEEKNVNIRGEEGGRERWPLGECFGWRQDGWSGRQTVNAPFCQ